MYFVFLFSPPSIRRTRVYIYSVSNETSVKERFYASEQGKDENARGAEHRSMDFFLYRVGYALKPEDKLIQLESRAMFIHSTRDRMTSVYMTRSMHALLNLSIMKWINFGRNAEQQLKIR